MVEQTSTMYRATASFKRLLLLLGCLNGLVGIKRIADSFFAPEIYIKDFIQEYLMGKAILHGVDPYLPVTELARIWMASARYDRLQHPTPHPPLVGLLGVPFGALPYRSAALLWMAFELACLAVIVAQGMRWWRLPITKKNFGLCFLLTLGWVPVVEDLWLGQLNILLLMLLWFAWQAFREERDGLGGALLGTMFAVKLMAWPLFLFLALRRRWKALLVAGAVIASANALAAVVLGPEAIRHYYLHVGPQVAAIYRGHDGNYSMWTLGVRLFAGFGANFRVLPLVASETGMKLATLLFPALALGAGLWLAMRAKAFDTAFGLMVVTGILVSPIAWTHYVMLSGIPLMILLRRLAETGVSKNRAYALMVVIALLSIAGASYSYVAKLFGPPALADEPVVIPFAAGMLTLVPLAALLGLTVMFWRSDREPAPIRATAFEPVDEERATWNRRKQLA